MSDLARYKPRWVGTLELNIEDRWRATWVDEQELPEHAPVFYLYALVFKGDKGYVSRPEGSSESWRTVEGELEPGETVDEAVARMALQQVGATVKRTSLVGFLECKATTHKTDPRFKPGDVTVRPLYVVVAKSVEEIPEGAGFERRRLPLNEYMVAIRKRYPELDQDMARGAQMYAVMQARGEA
jgi:ADP-ribose pyrophosphatase YjhB (NUDIX family)